LQLARKKLGGEISWKDIFPHIYTLSNITTWLSQAAISMVPTVAKSMISKLLHIIHSQWIYQNFTHHDKLCGYLHKKKIKDIRLTIEELAETPPEEIPKESKFLLEVNFGKLTKSHIKNQQY
jgi:hypothetical protein